MFTADAVDEDCVSNTSTNTNLAIQRGTKNLEKGLGVAPFIERNSDKIASTLESRRRVLRSQEAIQAYSISRQQRTTEERERALLEIEIERIRKHYQEQESILKREIMMHELVIKQLKKEEEDEKYYPVDWSGEVQSDYQPTECGDDGSG